MSAGTVPGKLADIRARLSSSRETHGQNVKEALIRREQSMHEAHAAPALIEAHLTPSSGNAFHQLPAHARSKVQELMANWSQNSGSGEKITIASVQGGPAFAFTPAQEKTPNANEVGA